MIWLICDCLTKYIIPIRQRKNIFEFFYRHLVYGSRWCFCSLEFMIVNIRKWSLMSSLIILFCKSWSIIVFVSIWSIYLFIYLFILQTQIYTVINIKRNTSYKFKQKYVCRWPVENQNMFCRQAPLNIDIMSMINFWSLLYNPPVENTHYRGHCYLSLKLIIIISSIQF